MAKILVVDDEEQMRQMVQLGLVEHEVDTAPNGLEGLLKAKHNKPDLILLDVSMPGIDGFETCRRLRLDSDIAGIPVIFATGQDSLGDKLEGFDAGADDYVVKPFELPELASRITAVLRRAMPQDEPQHLQVGRLSLNLYSRSVTSPYRSVTLTPTEFKLLEYLMRHTEVLRPTSTILEDVWLYPRGVGDPALVRMHVRNLREKLESEPSYPEFIQTVGRQGYILRG